MDASFARGALEEDLKPPPYLVEVRDYLQAQERELWNWFASARAQADYAEHLRLALLKSTYRLEPDSHPDLYRAVADAQAGLGLDLPVTVYQAQNSPAPNAALSFLPGEGHLVLSGPVLSLLNAAELRSVLGHELAHHHLWQWERGALHVADRLLQACAQDPRAAVSHEQTARRFRLYTEIFADRGSLRVTGDVHPVVAGLVKVETGLTEVSAAGYLRQADEILAGAAVRTEGVSHPELFIRARALALWQQQRGGADARIAAMIEGPGAFAELDLPGQTRLTAGTRRLLEQLLRPEWFQTPAVLGHARLYFPDFQPARTRDDAVVEGLRSEDPGRREYLAYVLLDFVTADADLDSLPLAAALALGRQLGLGDDFEKLAARELRLKARDLRQAREQAAEMLAHAEVVRE